MSQSDQTLTDGQRKLRIMIAGEFSAGKTHLINALVGRQLLPTNVTATHLPPMWLVNGEPGRVILDTDGALQDIDDFEAITLETAQYGIIADRSPFLEKYDIIDTPGNSDPNIPAEYWERMLDYADVVIWCSNATQAWRQSEKSVWTEMPDKFLGTGLMVITHGDLMPDERTAGRVLRRVEREAKGYFNKILLVSLLDNDDVAGIQAAIDEIAKGLHRHGADNDLVTKFANETGRVAPEPIADDDEEAAVLIQPALPTGPVGPESAVTPSESAEIVPLSKGQTESSTSAKDTEARRIWADLTEGRDLSDAKIVLSYVERLFDQLEQLAEVADSKTLSPAERKKNLRRRARIAKQRRTS